MLFELIKSKCLPILLYGTNVCPMNLAVRHSLHTHTHTRLTALCPGLPGVDKMSSKLESDVCCRLQVAPSGESYEGKRRPGRKQWQTAAGYMA